MKKLFITAVLSLAVLPLMMGCGKNSDASLPGGGEKPIVAVEAATVLPSAIEDVVEVTGSLTSKFAAAVKSQIPGLIREVYVTQWVRVQKGTPLARIDMAETEALVNRAEAAVESAKAELAQTKVMDNQSRRELARMLNLQQAGLATPQSVDDARTQAESAQVRIEAARSRVRVAEEEVRETRARLAKGNIVAPMDGVVALRDVNVGDLASDTASAKPLFRIVDNRILNLTVKVPSVDSARVQPRQPLEFTVDALPDRTFTGTVMYINPELNPLDRSLEIVAEVANDPEVLKAGLFAKGRIIIGRRDGVLQVPRSALAGLDSVAHQARIFVLDGDHARLRPVQTGFVNGDLVEILRGISRDERYVIRGGFVLKDGDKVMVAGGRENSGSAGL